MNRILLISSSNEIYSKYKELCLKQYSLISEIQVRDLDGLINWIIS